MANQRRKEVFTLVLVFAGVVLLSALVVYYVGGGRRATPETVRQGPTPDAVLRPPESSTSPTADLTDSSESFVDRLFGTSHAAGAASSATWGETMGRLTLRLLHYSERLSPFVRASEYSRSNVTLTFHKHRYCSRLLRLH